VKAEGRLTKAGLARPPTKKSGDLPLLAGGTTPAYIQRALKAHPAAKRFFESLAPSHRRAYLVWIDSAKREETKRQRLERALEMMAAGRKPGLQ
jgi:uncharacterized protein YdeI (YjbR/CyaY-like superfamily)